MAFQAIFQRREIKYFLDEPKYLALRAALEVANVNIEELLKRYKVDHLSDLTEAQHSRIIGGLDKWKQSAKSGT